MNPRRGSTPRRPAWLTDRQLWWDLDLSLKANTKLSLCTLWRLRGSRGIAPLILNHGIRWKWMVSFTPLPLYPSGRNPGTHCIGGSLCARADMEKRKIAWLCLDSNPGPSSMQPSHYTDWAIPRPVLSYSVSCFPGTADLTFQVSTNWHGDRERLLMT